MKKLKSSLKRNVYFKYNCHFDRQVYSACFLGWKLQFKFSHSFSTIQNMQTFFVHQKLHLLVKRTKFCLHAEIDLSACRKMHPVGSSFFCMQFSVKIHATKNISCRQNYFCMYFSAWQWNHAVQTKFWKIPVFRAEFCMIEWLTL